MTRKRKCRHCQEYTRYFITVPLGAFCNQDHMMAYALDKQNQEAGKRKKKAAEKKENAKKKREFYEQDIKTRREAATYWFNKYIRLRDRNLPCISCGALPGSCKFDAGHYRPAGSCMALAYSEWNVNGQCSVRCNVQKSGARLEYREGLLEKYGKEVVEFLDGPQPLVKKTPEYFKAVEEKYKEKCKLYSSKVPHETKEEF